MASLTREDLRIELRRAPLVTEATMRSVFREELEGILTLIQNALGTETCRFPEEPAPLHAFADVDAVETNPSTTRSATSVTQMYNHGPAAARHTISTRKFADMFQDSSEALDSAETPMANTCAEEKFEQTSVCSLSCPSESGDPSKSYIDLSRQISKVRKSKTKIAAPPYESLYVQAPSQKPPPLPNAPEVVLPGEITSQQLESDLPVMPDSSNMAESDEVVPSSGPRRSLNSVNSQTSSGWLLSPSVRASSKEKPTDSEILKGKLSPISSDSEILTTSRIRLSRWAACIVSHSIFPFIVASLILLNGVLVGVQTDHLARELTDETPAAFQILEMIFCACFTTELCLRLCAYGIRFLTMAGKWWNIFDLFVVMAQILEICMEAVASGAGYSFNFLRVLRVLGLIRVIRIARVLNLIGELRAIVVSIGGSMKPLFWTGVLLFMVVYVLGVYTTQVVLSRRLAYQQDNELTPQDLEVHWGDLGKSIMSLFQSITGGVDWDQVARPLTEHVSPEMGILFSIYIGFTIFCLLNVVTAFLIESGLNHAKSEKQLRAMTHIMQLFAKLDVEQTGGIAWEDFSKNLHKNEMQEFFKAIDVDIDNARTLFELLDVDSSGSVDVQEFMDGCLSIWAPTRGVELRMVLRDVNKVLGILLEDRQQRCQRLEDHMKCVGG